MRAIKPVLLRTILSLALGCFLWFSALPAHADGIFPPTPVLLPPAYDVRGAFLIVGNDACSGLPCTETITFAFDFGYYAYGTDYYIPYWSDFLATGSGALGSFTDSFAGPGRFGGEFNFLAIGDAGGDEFDILSSVFYAGVLVPVAPEFRAADLYACETKTCITDFAPFPGGNPPEIGLFVFGPIVSTVTAIPEPATLSLLACGLLALGLMEFAHRKIRVQKGLITPLS